MFILEVNNFTYRYSNQEQNALNNINLKVKKGEILLVVGKSGSGKSTLAKALVGLIPDFYGGHVEGQVFLENKLLKEYSVLEISQKIGLVIQEVDSQLFLDNVERDIAFGLENQAVEPSLMKRRVAEIIDLFNLNNIKNKTINNLSGGEKQKIALAGILAVNPLVLVLDEPTSQLDPVAAQDFFNIIKMLNEDMGITIILIEQRLEKCLNIADRVIYIENGRVIYSGNTREYINWAKDNNIILIPTLNEVFSRFNINYPVLNVRQAREVLDNLMKNEISSNNYELINNNDKDILMKFKDVYFNYDKGNNVLKKININILAGEIVAVVGANGAGKSTLLKIMTRLIKPIKGNIIAKVSNIAFLPQNLNDYFIGITVEEDIIINLKDKNKEKLNIYLKQLNIEHLRNRNPRLLSLGEKQKAALASLLALEPDLLLLDEPTQGLDYNYKDFLGKFLKQLSKDNGKSIVLVTHDIEFASEYAERIIFMHDGKILADGSSVQILSDNLNYSSQIAKTFKGYANGIINKESAIKKLQLINNKV